jgi:plasmid stabilization system protein ParE
VDYRLLYTQKALNDLAGIVGHFAEGDAEAASRFVNSLLDHLDLLTRFPLHGKHPSEAGTGAEAGAQSNSGLLPNPRGPTRD